MTESKAVKELLIKYQVNNENVNRKMKNYGLNFIAFFLSSLLSAQTKAGQSVKVLAGMDTMIEACYSLDLDNNGQISDSELGVVSDYLHSWGLALDVRKACHRLMNDLYLRSMRTQVSAPDFNQPEIGYYVINLKKSKDRLDLMNKHFHDAKLQFFRIEAIYGKDFKLSDLVKEGFYKPYPHPDRYLMPGEVGIYLSQRKTWKQIIKDDVIYGVIFEDDVEIPLDLHERVSEIVTLAPKDWNILYLGCNSENKDKFFESCRPQNLKRVPKIPLIELNDKCVAGSWAYIVKRSTAENLLKNSLPIEWPIDYMIKNDFLGRQNYGPFKAYCASPEIVRTGISGGSVIGDRGRCKTVDCDDK